LISKALISSFHNIVGAYEPRYLWESIVARSQQTELLVDLLYQGLGLAGRDGTRRHLAMLLEQLVYDACDVQDAFMRDVAHAEPRCDERAGLPVVAWWKAQGWLSRGLQARGVLRGAGEEEDGEEARAAGLVLPQREGTAARVAAMLALLDGEREDVCFEAAGFLQHVSPRFKAQLMRAG
jgi:hypothetical protein